jgi:HNH endonuclease
MALSKCKSRDNNRCVLTKRGSPQVAHIFPYTMLNKPLTKSKYPGTIPDFWSLLWAFWPEDQIERWHKTVFPDPEKPNSGIEACLNLICLSPDAHDLWNRGLFALKPLELSPDKKELNAQFFWQPRYDHRIGDGIDLLKEPLSSEGLKGVGDEYFLVYDYHGEPKYIVSGEIFTFKTEDPEEQPLPSWELLDLQWKLQRVVAMSGAAEPLELELFDFDDDDFSPDPALILDDFRPLTSPLSSHSTFGLPEKSELKHFDRQNVTLQTPVETGNSQVFTSSISGLPPPKRARLGT